MTRVMFFHTKNVAEIKKVKEEDGRINVFNKTFYVDETTPILIKTPFGTEKLYIVKWNCIYPAKIEGKVETKETGERKIIENGKTTIVKEIERNIITQLIFERDRKNTPESLFKSTTLKIVGGMLRLKKPVGGLLPLVFGVLIGSAVIFLMGYLHLIRF